MNVFKYQATGGQDQKLHLYLQVIRLPVIGFEFIAGPGTIRQKFNNVRKTFHKRFHESFRLAKFIAELHART